MLVNAAFLGSHCRGVAKGGSCTFGSRRDLELLGGGSDRSESFATEAEGRGGEEVLKASDLRRCSLFSGFE